MWSLGNVRRSPRREDWDKIKVDTMYEICFAKYKCNPELCAELLDTGDAIIEGNPSTSWTHPVLGYQNWSHWNGLIQMKCREMLRVEEDRDVELLTQINRSMDKYRNGYPAALG
mmetsp:Transcript_7220/g.10584  ORF Transcript_7220/g.10584 Transcript_7220/m.10584 type:complete len:114 (-) Transcript_7220:35-376(-)